MHRAPFIATLSLCLTLSLASASAQTGIQSAGASQPRSHTIADHAALPYQVHIEPTALPEGSTSIETGGDSWSARGYDLRTLIAQIYSIDARRIDFPDDSIAARRFDISVSLPTEVSDATMQQILEDAIQQRFGLSIAQESRPMPVYVLTAPNGPSAAMKRHAYRMTASEIGGYGVDSADNAGDSAGRITVYGQDCTDKGSQTGISVSGGSMADLRHTLEPDLDRVLLDETHLAGSYDFTVSNYSSQQQLFQLLHDQLGLVVTPAQRNVTVLAVRHAAAQNGNQSMQARL
jgi:uncharacterized protein (TIGR03435 family)